jgi:tRNA uridine 5-carboxymethylaminomethyl modification enzyme
MAGINAHLKLREKDPFILKRSDAYIGVLIDDLITKGTEEPYRMFTSRAEFRTLLRQDNADYRLTPLAYKVDLASEKRFQTMEQKYTTVEHLKKFIEKQSIEPKDVNRYLQSVQSSPLKQKQKLDTLLSRPQVSLPDILEYLPKLNEEFVAQSADDAIIEEVEISVKYKSYIHKEQLNAERVTKFEHIKLPSDFDYMQIQAISYEGREKLNRLKPSTIGQASRISGISPADISVLLVYMERR